MIARLKTLLLKNTSARQTVVKNTFWLFSGEAIGRLVRATIVIYSARILGAAEYGVFSYALGIAGFVSIFSDFGVGAILTRESVKNPQARQEYFSTALAIKFGFIIVNAALILFAVPFITKIDGVLPLLPLLVAQLTFDTLREYSFSLSRSLEKMEWEAGVKIATNVLITGLGFLMLWISASAKSLTLAYIIGSAIGFAIIFLVLFPYFRNFLRYVRLQLVGRILKLAWPIGLLGVLGSIMINTDMVMLGWWQTPTELGYYAAGQKPIQLLYIIPALLASAVFPVFTRLARANDERFRFVLERVISAVLAIAIPIIVVGVVVAPKLITFVYGAEYISATATFSLLLVTMALVFPSTILANALFAYDEQKQFLWFVSFGVVSNALLDYLLIPRFGIEGSAIATIISQAFSLWLVWRKMHSLNQFTILRHLPRIIVAALLSGIAAYAMLAWNVPVLINITVGAIVYVGVLWLLREPLFREVQEVVRA